MTLTATTDNDVGPTTFFILIVDEHGTILASCSSGTTCSQSVTQAGAGSHQYRAYLSTSSTTNTSNAQSNNTVTVTWQPPPTISSVSPATGSTAGGTTVTITGQSLTGTTAVSFGGTPASQFAVNSDTKVTATAPPHSPGVADVTVTTPVGTSATSSGDRFTYVTPVRRCVVPKLKRETLAQAKAALARAGCKLGIIAKPKHRKGKLVVKSESPSAGTVLASGASVSVKLKPKSHKKHH